MALENSFYHVLNAIKAVLNKLHGGKLFITDDRIQQAKDTYQKAKQKKQKDSETLRKVEATSDQIKNDMVEENQNEIQKTFEQSNHDLVTKDKQKINEKTESFEKILANLEKEHEARDLEWLTERNRQRFLLKNRLRQRIHPKYNDEISDEQIARTELELTKTAKNVMNDYCKDNVELENNFKNDRIEIIQAELEKTDLSQAETERLLDQSNNQIKFKSKIKRSLQYVNLVLIIIDGKTAFYII